MRSRVLFLLVGLVVLAAVAAGDGQFFCGRRLANTLAQLCPGADKRAALGWWRRGKRGGVVAECCDNPCTIDELLSYC
ncbi:bombyxin B-1-like [Ostrinia furnacalis]|uniref:bombyxin B-1-like n=1 Tax=Ostrinia furnacalis TaxID=93504 RepID=UPI0010401E10|nr:bombyxin B-1-like [Ostrinia furnacalis]